MFPGWVRVTNSTITPESRSATASVRQRMTCPDPIFLDESVRITIFIINQSLTVIAASSFVYHNSRFSTANTIS